MVYLLDAMHYDVRIGRAEKGLVVMVNTGNRLYDVPFVEVDSTRYYVIGMENKKSRIHTYEKQMAGAERRVNMRIDYSPRLGGELSKKRYEYHFKDKKIAFRVNQPLMDFYNNYPQTELTVYATAAMEEVVAAEIERQMRPFIGDKGEIEAINILLEYMQRGFRYMQDDRQFGKEKTFFSEENFYYAANDCEDRAVLFAKMVRVLLGYEVVLLEYKDHVATAVCVPKSKTKGYHIDIEGQRFMVCDPTCVGAKIGVIGKRYRHQRPNIVMTK